MSNTLQPHALQPTRLFCPWDFPGKISGVDYHFLLHMIFSSQESNPCLLHWQADSLPLCHLGSPVFTCSKKMIQLIYKMANIRQRINTCEKLTKVKITLYLCSETPYRNQFFVHLWCGCTLWSLWGHIGDKYDMATNAMHFLLLWGWVPIEIVSCP